MLVQGSISNFSRELKWLIGIYLFVTSIGFLTAIQFVNVTTAGTPRGIEENYLGNEDDLEAVEMKFAKSERQILNIVHAHVLSMAMLFLILAMLVATSPVSGFLRKLLIIEPMVSVFFTFGGIYFLTKGILWMTYVVMVSGIMMTISFVLSVLLVAYGLIRRPAN